MQILLVWCVYLLHNRSWALAACNLVFPCLYSLVLQASRLIAPYNSSGIDYITFIDLGDKESSVKQEVLEPDILGEESSDYFSSPVFIENGIPIGATGELATRLYVRNQLYYDAFIIIAWHACTSQSNCIIILIRQYFTLFWWHASQQNDRYCQCDEREILVGSSARDWHAKKHWCMDIMHEGEIGRGTKESTMWPRTSTLRSILAEHRQSISASILFCIWSMFCT